MAKRIKSKNLTITARIDSKAYVSAVEMAVKKIIDEGVQVKVPLNKVKIKVEKVKTDEVESKGDLWSLILGLGVALVMIFLAWGWYKERQSKVVVITEPVVTPLVVPTAPTATQSGGQAPTVTPVWLNKNIKIQVLNASTNSKKGYWVKSELAKMGYEKVAVGSYSIISGKTEVKYNPKYSKEAQSMAKMLGASLGLQLTNYYPYSVVIVVGNR